MLLYVCFFEFNFQNLLLDDDDDDDAHVARCWKVDGLNIYLELLYDCIDLKNAHKIERKLNVRSHFVLHQQHLIIDRLFRISNFSGTYAVEYSRRTELVFVT